MAELPDPSTLTDEELDSLLETGKFPDKPEDKPDDDAEDEDKPEDKEDKPEDKKEDKEDPEDKPEDKPADKTDEDEDKPEDKPEPKPTSRREQSRVRDLLEKYGEPAPNKQAPKPTPGIDYEKELDADPELLKKLGDDRTAASQDGFNQGLEQAKSLTFLTRLEIDAPRVEAKYPQLDKNSAEFKPEAATDVNLLFLRLAGYDVTTKEVKHPELRYTDFVETIFGLANDLADVKVEKQVKEVKKQASQTGIRPDGSGAKKLDLTKAPEDMSDEELDAYLAQAIPKR